MSVPVILELTAPPSSNRYWRLVKSRIYRTHEADTYREMVAAKTHPHRVNGEPTFPTEPLNVVILWHRAIKSGDLDNRIKILCDALQGTLYAKDSQIVQIWARRVDEHGDLPKGMVRVEVGPA